MYHLLSKEILILLCFSFIISYVEFQIDNQIDKITSTYGYSETFRISYLNNYDFDYLTIKIENQYSSGQISFLSYSDINCKKDRKQMSLNINGKSAFIIKNSEAKSISPFYICVNCLNTGNCKYNLKSDQNYKQRLPFNEYSFIYHSSKIYANMELGFRAENDIIDIIKGNSQQNYYEIFWVKRNFNNKFITDFGLNDFPKTLNITSDYNAVYLIDNFDKENKIIDFNISSKEENMIFVGSKFIYGDENYSFINVNDIETIGHLQKNFKTECFKLNLIRDSDFYFIYGYIYEKFGKTYLMKNNQKISEKEIIDGNIFEVVQYDNYYDYYYYPSQKFCVTFLDSDKYEKLDQITFSIQLVSNKNKYPNYYYTFQQIPEFPFPRFLSQGEYMVLSGIREPSKSSLNISITLNSIYGTPMVSMYQCKNFPLYNFNKNDFKEIFPNIMKDYNFSYINRFSPNNTLLAINCSSTTDFCIFDTIFFSKNDYILLNEGKIFSQILLAEDKNYFRINFEKYKGVKSIYLELLNLNRNIKLAFEKNSFLDEKLKIVNYFLINKYIYIININDLKYQELKFEIKSEKKSLYTIRYNLIRNEQDLKKMNILDIIGTSYIDYINASDNYKIIEIQNYKYDKSFPILYSIYSPDCRLKIKNDTKEMKTSLYNNFYLEYIPENKKNNYSLNISVIEHQSRRCLLYTNNIKIYNENSDKIGTLLINENIPQIMSFKDIKKMRYIFPNIHKDNNYQILIQLKILKNSTYSLNIKNYNDINNFQITSNQIITIQTKNLEFEEEEENKLIFEISLNKAFSENPMLETIVYQKNNKFYYLEKGLYKNYILGVNEDLYLYTDIWSEDQGYATYDFLKGKNEIKGKIVEIDEINISEDANWETLKNENEIKYDLYTKKMIFNKNDTSKCNKGCYLLIYVHAPTVNFYIKNFEINLMVSLTKFDVFHMPKIKFNADQYITGNLVNKNYDNEEMYDLYELNVPFDANNFTIECISELATLFIFIGNPENYNEKKIEIKPNQIINISKQSLLNLQSFEDINIVVYVYAKKVDLIDIPYSFKIHLNKENELEINKVYNNQKTLCIPKKIPDNNKYRCLFMINPSTLYKINYLLLYAKSQYENSEINIYGQYFSQNDDINSFPNEKSPYSNKEDGNNFMVIEPNEYQFDFYVSVISNSSNTIEFITNFYNYYKGYIPTPNIMQIYVLGKSFSNEIMLNFVSVNSIYINMVSLKGEGQINFKDKYFYLKGKDFKKSFALNGGDDKEFNIINTGNQGENFIFYIYNNLRNSTVNYDEISFGENYEIEYEFADYPLYLYSEINNKVNHDINIFFNFYNLTLNNISQIEKFVKKKELKVLILFIENEKKYKLINDSKNNWIKFEGIYDPAIRAGQVLIPSENISEALSNNNSLFLLEIEKNGENNDIIYEGMNMKATFIKENSGIPIEKNKYYLGKVYDKVNTYKIGVDKLSDNIAIEFAANSKLFNFSITDEENIQNYENENNTYKILEYKENEGKIIATYKNPQNVDNLYLHIFINNNLNETANSTKNATVNLNNYIFKYKNIFKINRDNEYQITNNNRKLKCEKNSKQMVNIYYDKIKNQENYEIIYSLKIIKKEDLIEGEIFDTIAITESNSNIIQFTKFKDNDNNKDKISFPESYLEGNFSYIILIAQIIDRDNIEYIAYEPTTSNEILYKPDDDNDDEDSSKLFYVGIIGGISLILIITGIIIYFKCKKKKIRTEDSIMKQVEMANPIEYDDVLLDQS